MEVVEVKTEKGRIEKVRQLILSAGNKIGSVYFKKRSDGSLRRMNFRLHVYHPTYACQPLGKRHKSRVSKDYNNHQMTVLDVNKVRRNQKGRISGRGDWRTIPLEKVERICVNGKIYRIKS